METFKKCPKLNIQKVQGSINKLSKMNASIIDVKLNFETIKLKI